MARNLPPSPRPACIRFYQWLYQNLLVALFRIDHFASDFSLILNLLVASESITSFIEMHLIIRMNKHRADVLARA